MASKLADFLFSRRAHAADISWTEIGVVSHVTEIPVC